MNRKIIILSVCVGILMAGCARPKLFNENGDLKAAYLVPRTEPQLLEETKRDAAFPNQPGSSNATLEFTRLFYDFENIMTAERVECLTRYDVLLVHGLMGEVGVGVRRFLDKIGSKQRILDYQKDQEQALDDHGISHRMVTFRSKNVDRSGQKIVDSILKSKKPVLLFSHSKGCVDTLDALIKLSKQGKLDRVVGWISSQGVFHGAPKAEQFVKNNGLRNFGIVGMRVLGGNFNAIRDLTPEARATYHATHQKEIAKIVKQVPIICFASWEMPGKSKELDSKKDKAKSQQLTSAYKIQPQSSILFGCDYVAKAGVSHSATVVRSKKPYNRLAFTKALFAMLADRITSK